MADGQPGPLPTTYDPDTGRCDDCGTEDGHRHALMVTITVGGVKERAQAWLCSPCRDRRLGRG